MLRHCGLLILSLAASGAPVADEVSLLQRGAAKLTGMEGGEDDSTARLDGLELEERAETALVFEDLVKASTTPEPECTGAVDLMLALDQSNSIGAEHFDMLRTGLIEMVDEFAFDGEKAAKVGVCKFSHEVVKLYEGLSSDQAEIEKHIKNMSYDGGWTHTHSALAQAAKELETHGRVGVAKVIVVMTDGECRIGHGDDGKHIRCDKEVLATAGQIKASGLVIDEVRHPVTIIAVGFGKNAGTSGSEHKELSKELRYMASQKVDVILAEHYTDFASSVAPQVGDLACEQVGQMSMDSGECTMGSCVIWGDPHVMTFKMFNRSTAKFPRAQLTDGHSKNIHTAGSQVLVHTDTVHIEGALVESKPGHIALKSLDIGGSFLQGNRFVIRPNGKQTTWNGDEIVPKINEEFENDFVHIYWSRKSTNVIDGTRAVALEVFLPGGVHLTVNRWRTMLMAEINMCVAVKHQSGLCGSFSASSK